MKHQTFPRQPEGVSRAVLRAAHAINQRHLNMLTVHGDFRCWGCDTSRSNEVDYCAGCDEVTGSYVDREGL